ncbi:hypothetical protein T265_10369 [Opisthorchis viverrini]|uniref:Uncharacterized protein n=1 Tax=Opisthorchis viverrini TaxID=6198 RepID=A0A074Z2R8_OPIVI|nr:hypothetical protein T265_10369 [Opisthorchis viverrini]KER21268.1 hypothetical protein T265_10369 [Opisthorchis viverrini]
MTSCFLEDWVELAHGSCTHATNTLHRSSISRVVVVAFCRSGAGSPSELLTESQDASFEFRLGLVLLSTRDTKLTVPFDFALRSVASSGTCRVTMDGIGERIRFSCVTQRSKDMMNENKRSASKIVRFLQKQPQIIVCVQDVAYPWSRLILLVIVYHTQSEPRFKQAFLDAKQG